MKTTIYTNKGQVKGDFTFSKDLEVNNNKSLIDQAIRVFEDSTHFGLNKVKTRSEVNITKKKIYRQKGTGGARHGAKSAHIFVGGGVAHGPTGLKRKLNLSTKMKQSAKLVALSMAIKSKKLVMVEGLEKLTKTKDVNNLVESIKKENNKNAKVTLILSDKNMGVRRYAKNIKNLNVVEYKTLNAFNIMSASLLIVDEQVFEVKKESAVKVKKTTKK